MGCIGWDRERDPKLHDHYARKLLEPGWAGLFTLAEAQYIKRVLERDGMLRRRWGIRRKKVPLSLIAEKAYPEDPAAARWHIAAEQRRARRQKSVDTPKCRLGRMGWGWGSQPYDEFTHPGETGRTASYAQEDKGRTQGRKNCEWR